MEFMRPLGSTGIEVSALGLGTVKIGRNEQVKYPHAFSLPDDAAVGNLLSLARELGINLIDTAPAYGDSEARLGAMLGNRKDWILCTKTGEEFIDGASRFDFSAEHTRFSVERSLRRLNTDYLDIVLIHSDGNDEAIVEDGQCVQALRELQKQGLVRAIGMSTKTVKGGLAALEVCDVVMLTYNLEHRDQAVLEEAVRRNKGVLVKKGLMSGHLAPGNEKDDLLRESMKLCFSQLGIASMIVGTINPDHLRGNVACAREIIGDMQGPG